MANMNFNTANQTFRQLLGNGLGYKVPKFQRDYSWSSEEWDDLWQDLMALFEDDGESAHYMGYLVLQSSDSKNFDIIDGQQRLTTMSILILSCLSHLKNLADAGIDTENNTKRKDNLRSGYIGYVDPVTLISKPKLELNRHNNKFYQNYLMLLEKPPTRGINSSEHLMRKAYDWFHKQIKTYTGESGIKVAEFIDSIVDKLFFTVITVTDELNAFKVFETLNSRGVRLSSTDLLKNYLFSIISAEDVHEEEINHLEETWEEIIGTLKSENFPEFLRTYWNSKNKIIRKTDLFKAIRKNISTKEDAFKLIRNLERSSRIYAALRNPSDSSWSEFKEDKNYLGNLKLFNVKQPFGLLLRVFELCEDNRTVFTKILKTVVSFSFRYNVICNKQTNDLEGMYNSICLSLENSDDKIFTKVLSRLKGLYPEDNEFKNAFANKEMRTTNSRNKKVVRYILFSLEKEITGADYDFDSSKFNIEHILPENPEEGWEEFKEENIPNYIYKIGNMTLMDTTPNREIGNCQYSVKIETYKDSRFQLTKAIAENYQEWKETIIESRQTQLSKKANTIWRINFE